MKTLRKLLLLALPLCIHFSMAQQIKTESLEPFIEKLMRDFEVPGLAIGIVEGGEVRYVKGFGTRTIHKDLAVDTNTIFAIGSISKSFTALTLGILVDQGKLDWEDKVKDHLPYFELYDPYVTQNFTIRDLLTHRSGLKEISGGTLWYHSDLSRTEIIKKLKYLKPEAGFREKAAYQNTMYMVAGEVVGAVSGQPWDEFLKTEVFDKLRMYRSTSVAAVRETSSNLAHAHVWDEAYKKVPVPQEKGDNLAAAGFIYSSASEMNNYMKMLLNHGVFENDTIIRKATLDEIFRPQMLYPIPGSTFGNEFTSYGFGWWVTPKKDGELIEHNGGIDGMAAKLFMLPEKQLGVIILTNVSKEPASYLLKAKLLEQLWNDPSLDFYDNVKGYRDRRVTGNLDNTDRIPKTNDTNPSKKLESYAGTYTDAMYGDIQIKSLSGGKLELSFSHTPLFKAHLEHWHYDTFRVDWHDLRIPNGFLTFDFDSHGDIIGFDFDQTNLLDVDFSELNIKKKP